MNDPPCERLEMSGLLCLLLPQIFCCWEMKCQIITELERPWSTGEHDWPWPRAIVWSGKHRVVERGGDKTLTQKHQKQSKIWQLDYFQDWSEHNRRRRQDSLRHCWRPIHHGWVRRPEAQGHVLNVTRYNEVKYRKKNIKHVKFRICTKTTLCSGIHKTCGFPRDDVRRYFTLIFKLKVQHLSEK